MKSVLIALAAFSFAAAPLAAQETADIPAGEYRLDPYHASLIFRVDHLGFSNYTACFTGFDATLTLDPANPADASVTASIDPASLTLDRAPDGFTDTLLGEGWLEASEFPEITFRSTDVEMTGENTARITGDLTLHGVTRPVTLKAEFNGGYAGHPMDPNARIGFSARGRFDRSSFGVDQGVPEEGSEMGVSDAVEVIIEAEFLKPNPPAE